MDQILKEVSDKFIIDGLFEKHEINYVGHINNTYVVYYTGGSKKRYLFQKINVNIFEKPIELMENIYGVTNFLREKIVKNGGDPLRETLNVVKTKDGNIFYNDESGFWRVYDFIEDAITYMVVEKPSHMYEAGVAFGNFLMLLNDYPAESLNETIKDFHNTKKRYDTFIQTVSNDLKGRAKNIKNEIDFVIAREKDTSVIVDLLKNAQLPLRVTHNDTKFNNVMIDIKTDKAVCVVDLDTVMPGSLLYDFGDSIRSGTNTGLEDEPDLTKVSFDIELFEQFTKGYLEMSKNALTEKEKELLVLGCRIITLECGIRFLTDYLNGDTYFKTSYENHNLDRTRTQFKLVKDMEEMEKEMEEIVKKYSN